MSEFDNDEDVEMKDEPVSLSEPLPARRVKPKKAKSKTLSQTRNERLKKHNAGFSLRLHNRADHFEVIVEEDGEEEKKAAQEEGRKACVSTINVNKRFLASGSYGAVFDILTKAYENKEVLKVVPLAKGVDHQTEDFNRIIEDLSKMPVNEGLVQQFEREFDALSRASALGVGPPSVQAILCKEHRVGFIMMTKGRVVELGIGSAFDYKVGIEAMNLVQKLHKNGIWHQDVHKGNLMMFGDQLRIIDFGLAVDFKQDLDLRGTPCSYYDMLLLASSIENARLFNETYEAIKEHAKRELVMRTLLIEREFGKDEYAREIDSPGMRSMLLSKMTWKPKCGLMFLDFVRDQFKQNSRDVKEGRTPEPGDWDNQMENYMLRLMYRASFSLLIMKDVGLKLDANTASTFFRVVLVCRLNGEYIDGAQIMASAEVNEVVDTIMRGHFPDEIIKGYLEKRV